MIGAATTFQLAQRERVSVKFDRAHRWWLVFAVATTLLLLIGYVWYVLSSPTPPRGGSWQGMLFGSTAFVIFCFAASFSIRKRFPQIRWLGSAKTWLRAHIWLSLLTVPLVFFHTGFGFGGIYETVLMILFIVVIASGIYGWWQQHRMPVQMMQQTPSETIFSQIPHVCEVLCNEGDKSLESLGVPVIAGGVGDARATMQSQETMLSDFYLTTVRPFLSVEGDKTSKLANASGAATLFKDVHSMTPNNMHPILDKFRELCDERRELTEQARLHLRLHYWLLIHIPLSMALIVLTLLHIITAGYLY